MHNKLLSVNDRYFNWISMHYTRIICRTRPHYISGL
uniref:Uncharacterized protein n=1 Tax=Anguilla anguilla TaxID=7936 RepID=A0A0E9VC42_ANGAN